MNYPYMQPVEMPRGSHYGSDYWIAYSTKCNRHVHFYSMLEYSNFLILEMNPCVEYFCEQPLKISWEIESHKISTIFDFWVKYANGDNEFQEIKYSKELSGIDENSHRSQLQIKHQKKWCADNNQQHRVITEKEIFQGEYYIQNLKILQHKSSRYQCVDKAIYKKLLEDFLSQISTCSIEKIIDSKILPLSKEREFLALAYANGWIEININNRPLDYSSEVKLCESENSIY